MSVKKSLKSSLGDRRSGVAPTQPLAPTDLWDSLQGMSPTGLLTSGMLGCRNFSCVLHLQIAGGCRLSCSFIGIASRSSLSHGLCKGVTGQW